MANSIVELLARLTKVKQIGPGRFVACCPAHSDKNPSLTVRELPDGRILLHCFGGCDTQAVLDAIGMTFSDLFPEPLTRETLSGIPRPFSADEALLCLTSESLILAICASQLQEGKALSITDEQRLWLASGRIATALEVIHGGR